MPKALVNRAAATPTQECPTGCTTRSTRQTTAAQASKATVQGNRNKAPTEGKATSSVDSADVANKAQPSGEVAPTQTPLAHMADQLEQIIQTYKMEAAARQQIEGII
jgi:hypothetical protein